MSWNYRITKTGGSYFLPTYNIREVYYSDNGAIEYWTLDPMNPSGTSKQELIEDLLKMLAALNRPVIDLEKEEKQLKST